MVLESLEVSHYDILRGPPVMHPMKLPRVFRDMAYLVARSVRANRAGGMDYSLKGSLQYFGEFL